MASNLVRILEVDASILGRSITRALSAGLSGRAQNRIAVATREALRTAYKRAILDAFSDRAVRSGNARNIMRAGIRVFGSRNVTSIRGHVLGPAYIKAQDEGAKIVPKNAKALAIPMEAALRPDGTPKLPGPRSWQNIRKTFIYKSKRTGRAYIAYNNGPGGSLVLLYLLVDEVQLRGNVGFLTNALNAQLPFVAAEFAEAFALELATAQPTLGRRAGLSPKYDRRRR